VDCTLGGGGHTRALLAGVRPGGRVIGLDIDPVELPRTEERLRAEGWTPEMFSARQGNFAGLPHLLRFRWIALGVQLLVFVMERAGMRAWIAWASHEQQLAEL